MVPDGKSIGGTHSPPLVVFRVDSSRTIGSGHLRRCLVLAKHLREMGARTLFLCRDHPGNDNALVVGEGHELCVIGDSGARAAPVHADHAHGYAAWLGVSVAEDAAATKGALAGRPASVLIVDHYAIDACWHHDVRQCVSRVVVIDDLCDRPHDCDVLLDTAPGDAGRYDHLVPDSAQKLLGPRYALLRPEFEDAARVPRTRSGRIDRILVAFGGIDADNITAVALDAIAATLPDNVSVDVVLGRSAPHIDAVRDRCETQEQWALHVDTDEIAMLMRAADLAIGAAGVISWERASLGLPAVVVVIADNQRRTADGLAVAGCAIAVPPISPRLEGIAGALALLANNPGLMAAMSVAGRALVDGRGRARVAAAVLPAPAIELRAATMQDAALLWRWRNDPAVRAVSLQSDPIELADHGRWLDGKLGDPNAIILIGRQHATDIGVVRYDLVGTRARVSIQLAPGATGNGLGSALLAAAETRLRRDRPEIVEIVADVLDTNAASLALFRAAAYRPHVYQLRRVLNSDAV